MENFKINDYSTNEQDKKSLERESSFEEFQDFKFDSFESLNSEQQKEIEKTQESSKNEALDLLVKTVIRNMQWNTTKKVINASDQTNNDNQNIQQK